MLANDPSLKVAVNDAAMCRRQLRTSRPISSLFPDRARWPGTNSCSTRRAPRACWRETRPIECSCASNPNSPIAPEIAVAEPGGRYIDFLIPGLLGINLLGGGLFGVGFVTADARPQALETIPGHADARSDFLLSLMLSRLVFTLIDIGLLLAVAYWAFDTRVRGDFLAFLVLVVAGGACFAGVGLLVGSRARTIETAAGLMNAVMLPMYVLSGVFFSATRFPDWMQPFIQLLPLTVVNDGLRAIMNDGAGFESLGYPLLVVCLWSVVCFALALRIFRWR